LQALKNVPDPDQDFLLVVAGQETVSCTLVVRSAGIAGIYAVATLPDRRKAGYSGAALEHVRKRVIADGGTRIGLQAAAGSYAEGYYRRLGFEERYGSQVWRLPDDVAAWRAS
jgi:GNAT superfamily N-acetyltransferase